MVGTEDGGGSCDRGGRGFVGCGVAVGSGDMEGLRDAVGCDDGWNDEEGCEEMEGGDDGLDDEEGENDGRGDMVGITRQPGCGHFGDGEAEGEEVFRFGSLDGSRVGPGAPLDTGASVKTGGLTGGRTGGGSGHRGGRSSRRRKNKGGNGINTVGREVGGSVRGSRRQCVGRGVSDGPVTGGDVGSSAFVPCGCGDGRVAGGEVELFPFVSCGANVGRGMEGDAGGDSPPPSSFIVGSLAGLSEAVRPSPLGAFVTRDGTKAFGDGDERGDTGQVLLDWMVSLTTNGLFVKVSLLSRQT